MTDEEILWERAREAAAELAATVLDLPNDGAWMGRFRALMQPLLAFGAATDLDTAHDRLWDAANAAAGAWGLNDVPDVTARAVRRVEAFAALLESQEGA